MGLWRAAVLAADEDKPAGAEVAPSPTVAAHDFDAVTTARRDPSAPKLTASCQYASMAGNSVCVQFGLGILIALGVLPHLSLSTLRDN